MFRAYACFKDHFKDQMKLLYTDTDSFYLHVTCEDFYKELIDVPALREWLDFSDILPNHPSGIGNVPNVNAGVLGKFKDETAGNPIIEFVGLRPKMYSCSICEAQLSCFESLPPNIKTKQTAKGISRPAKRTITHEDYVSMYNEGALRSVTNHRLESRLHQIYTVSQKKRGLCPYDDKRYLLANLANDKPNPNTHAFGHYELMHETAQLDIDQPASGENLHVYQFRNRNELCSNDTKSNSSLTLQRENLFRRKHKRALNKCAQHFTSNEILSTTELNSTESLDEDITTGNEQEEALSSGESLDDEHISQKSTKRSAHCSQFIDFEAKDTDGSDD